MMMKKKELKREEEEKTPVKEEADFQFWSNILKRPFATVAELKEAENKYSEEEKKKKELSQTKKERAEEIQNAYKELLDTKKKADEIINKARQEAFKLIETKEHCYNELVNSFCRDYGSYHMSYSNANGDERISISDTLDSFNSLFDLLLR